MFNFGTNPEKKFPFASQTEWRAPKGQRSLMLCYFSRSRDYFRTVVLLPIGHIFPYVDNDVLTSMRFGKRDTGSQPSTKSTQRTWVDTVGQNCSTDNWRPAFARIFPKDTASLPLASVHLTSRQGKRRDNTSLILFQPTPPPQDTEISRERRHGKFYYSQLPSVDLVIYLDQYTIPLYSTFRFVRQQLEYAFVLPLRYSSFPEFIVLLVYWFINSLLIFCSGGGLLSFSDVLFCLLASELCGIYRELTNSSPCSSYFYDQ